MKKNNPFHSGELEMQALAGDQRIASIVGQCIEPSIPRGAFEFLRQQTAVWIGVEDEEGYLNAFPLFGLPGFMDPNRTCLKITLGEQFSIPDAWRASFKKGKSVACIMLDFPTRSRIRINGVVDTLVVDTLSEDQLIINITQAFPNCPKYIQKRDIVGKLDSCDFEPEGDGEGSTLDKKAEAILQRSDTAFVASLGPNGADVSHRGGESGFIKYDSANNKIVMPDYVGNSMFNTLGNFKINPVGGLIVCDFTQGYFLQLSGAVRILFDQDYQDIESGGTQRYWELDIKKWNLFKVESNIQWAGLEFSPYNP
ncbi:MAG: pyridoxamine 5'-phosphate oxidase family protein [Cocleimonas sp.]